MNEAIDRMMDDISETVDPVDPKDPVETTPEVPEASTEPKKEGEGETPASEETPPAGENSTIKQMREAINQHKKDAETTKSVLARIAKANGFDSHEDYLKHLEQQEVEEAAKDKKISPELEKELRELKAMRLEAEEERRKSDFFFKMNQFKTAENLTDAEILEFADQAREMGLNLLDTPVPLNQLYRSLNFDKLEAKIREEERLKVLEEVKKQRQGVAQSRTTGDGDPPKKSMDDLYRDLAKGDLF